MNSNLLNEDGSPEEVQECVTDTVAMMLAALVHARSYLACGIKHSNSPVNDQETVAYLDSVITKVNGMPKR